MPQITDAFLRDQLLERRQRLEAAMAASREAAGVIDLLKQVDSALERMDNGSYGICEFCHESIGTEWLITNPLARFCLEHLSPEQRHLLERDLELASGIQREMLPKQHLTFGGWEVFYHYKALGAVSGDYCDLVPRVNDDRSLFFILGDVSGKGVAASMLMSHLHAIFRTLIVIDLPVHELVERASRVFCESALSPYFATLVCGRAGVSGEIQISNAGHCSPLLLREGKATKLEATGVPLGMFCDGKYPAETMHLSSGDTLFLYTDGLSEARNRSDEEYGEARLTEFLRDRAGLPPQTLVGECLKDLAQFLLGAPLTDDLTLMAIQRLGRG